jgi:hypothetical protein
LTEAAGDKKRHASRATMTGSRITGDLEGMKHLEADGATLTDLSRTGLWSNLDARPTSMTRVSSGANLVERAR